MGAKPEDFAHFGLYLDSLANDYQRYQACRAKAEKLRNQWFEGQRQAINDVIDAAMLGDHRYKRMSKEEIESTGQSRWSKTVDAKDLAGAEQMYHRWAYGYLQAWQSRPPGMIPHSGINITPGAPGYGPPLPGSYPPR